ncbi:MAG: ABC transporter ATP-binding protein [Bacteroidales bacterium]|nr:ABC transporter ATP-binding protein [Clostridium sp.]MCM1204287.1 ABC transporter ATP-binding protein [Bacteroidales bacterium]
MIVLKQITKTYGKGESTVRALQDVSLEIQKGEMISIMGASGSGKSTLLNVLGCMDKFDSGEYFYQDIAVHNLEKNKRHQFRKEHIGFVFQQFALMNQYTVYENVELPLCIQNVPKKERKRRVNEALEQMRIRELAKKMPTKISGGQQQRCAIARALASGNELILADEPTGALDVDNGNEIMNILTQLNKQGKTLVVITHDPEIAARTQRILHMEDGRIVEHDE